MKTFELPIRVYIEDTDAGGIVYYVNYLKFFERARTEMMRWYGYGKDYIFSADLMFVVGETRAKYLRPARLDDELVATATITEIGAAHLLFEQSVTRGDETLCQGTVQVVCVDRHSVKPRRIPKEIATTLKTDNRE